MTGLAVVLVASGERRKASISAGLISAGSNRVKVCRVMEILQRACSIRCSTTGPSASAGT